LVAGRLASDFLEIEDIVLGARLHDLGKAAIPDSIMRKPVPLDAYEIAVMRTHCAFGAEMLAAAGTASELQAMVRHHHERWDGMGYPDGLGGEAIPLGARIIAVVDAFDVMCPPQPHRAGPSRKEALLRIHKAKGTQFDPDVVDAFVASVFSVALRTDGKPRPEVIGLRGGRDSGCLVSGSA
jgi:HD-GYP domain-containing protein (c-di-GMP phosphodiesterase class II)